MTAGVRSLAQNPADHNYGVETDAYHAPQRGPSLGSHSATYRTSFQRAGGTFTTHQLQGEHIAGMSAQNRSTVVNWDSEPGATPGFNKG